MFITPELLNPMLKLKTPKGSQVVSFSMPHPIAERSAGKPKVLGLICTQPALLALVTVMSSARAATEKNRHRASAPRILLNLMAESSVKPSGRLSLTNLSATKRSCQVHEKGELTEVR